MEFRAKQVVSKRNRRAIVAYAGLVIAACSLVLALIPGMSEYVPWAFGGGVGLVVIGALIARGDVRTYGLSEEELVADGRGIRVGAEFYPLESVSELNWNVEAYAGLYVNDGAMVSGSNSDGMTNDVQFVVGGKTISCGFLLESKAHVQELGLLFDEYYRRRIPFVERNRNTRTYLFQHLTAQELVEFKKRYGYT